MYKFTPIDDNNYHFTKELYKLSFSVNQPVSEIQKKYDTSMFGLKNIGFFAVAGAAEPAAFYGVFPIMLTFEGKNFLAAQSGDTMTAPDHRGKGLFVQLAKMTYENAKSAGVKLIFGFPNENSFPGFQKKLDWEFQGHMQRFRFRNNSIPLCEISSKSYSLHVTYRKYCSRILSRYRIDLTEKNISGFRSINSKGHVTKDINFFEYKLKNKDNYLININGFTLLIKAKDHLIIGDVSYFDLNKLQEFVRTISKLARILGCKVTIFTVSKNHWLYKYLTSLIVPQVSLPIGYLRLDCELPLEDFTFTQADYDTF